MRLTVAGCASLPAVAVIVTCDVPAGVPPLDFGASEHDTSRATGIVSTNIASTTLHEPLRLRIDNKPKIPAKQTEIIRSTLPGIGGRAGPTGIAADLRAVVDIVTCVVAACTPSNVIDVGTNAHADAPGRFPQLNVTVCVEPFCGVTVSATLPLCPATTVSAMGFAETVKSPAAFTVCVTTADVLPA